MDGETIPEECYDLPDFNPALFTDPVDYEADQLLERLSKRQKVPESPGVSSVSSNEKNQELRHFKMKFDANFSHDDYVKISDVLFYESPKLLIVAEKMVQNPHVHWHGYSYYSEQTFKEKTRQLVTARHYTHNKDNPGYNPKQRPVSHASVASELGFQYLCKEQPVPIINRGFTEEQLRELHARSQELLHKLKFNTKEFVQGLVIPARLKEPKEIWQWTLAEVGDELAKKEKDPSWRFVKNDVKSGLLKHPQATRNLRGFLMNL